MLLLNAGKMADLPSVFGKCPGCLVMAKPNQKQRMILTMFSKNKLIISLRDTGNAQIGKMLKYRLHTI